MEISLSLNNFCREAKSLVRKNKKVVVAMNKDKVKNIFVWDPKS
jgi:hypothetical protein